LIFAEKNKRKGRNEKRKERDHLSSYNLNIIKGFTDGY